MGDGVDRFDAIAVRKSCRRYDMSRLPAWLLDDIHGLARAVTPLDDDAEIVLHVVEDGETLRDIMPGLVGAYGKVRAPHYLLCTGPRRDESYENAGFGIEPLVLTLTTLELGSCWIGGSARGDTFRRVIDYPPGHDVLIIVAFGMPAESGGHVRLPGTGRRRPLDQLLLSEPGDQWRPALEAARLAPSAWNKQPWRFHAEEERLDAYLSFTAPLHYRLFAQQLLRMNRLDVGIALAHVGIALTKEGRRVRATRVAEAPERQGLTYIASIEVG